MLAHRARIILAAARNNVPAVYSQSAFAKDGSLLSYGGDVPDLSSRAVTPESPAMFEGGPMMRAPS
jgi:hypothetical protein